MDYSITESDLELIDLAREAIIKRYREHWHSVGAALRTADGEIYTAVHIDANVGRIAVCAEAIAIANALYAGSRKFDTIVAVQYPADFAKKSDVRVVSPCGMCRELISDYDAETRVIYPDGKKVRKSDVLDLLPSKYI